MKKTIIMTLAVLSLMGIFVTGCASEGARPSVSTPVTPPASSQLPSSINSKTADTSSTGETTDTPTTLDITDTTSTDDTTSEIIQSGIPLKITEPADAAEIKAPVIAVKGQTVPDAAVSVNDIAGIADAEGNFSITINLEPGPNAVDVIATDDSGKQGEVLILVNVIS